MDSVCAIPAIIAVSGGIGSGKSVVCRILSVMGYEVYDCDSRAKRLMDESEEIKSRIGNEICPDAIIVGDNGCVIDRKRLAHAIFNDDARRLLLNEIVHNAVKEDIIRWHKSHASDNAHECRPLFIETALLYESGLDKMVDHIWEVSAPVEIRIARAMKRDNATQRDIELRVRAQQAAASMHHEKSVRDSAAEEGKGPAYAGIINDGETPLLPQILTLVSDL